MRIEIDTKNDTKEELAQLARMLMALSGSSASQVFDRPKHRDLFGDDAPSSGSGGIFNMFNDSPAQTSQTSPTSQSTPDTGTVFSIFDNPEPARSAEPEEKRDVVDELKIVPY